MMKLHKKSRISSSKNYSASLENARIELLGKLHNSFSKLQISYFIVGAAARDLVMDMQPVTATMLRVFSPRLIT